MTRYVLRRLIQAVPLLLVISMIVFLLMQLIPGGPTSVYENDPNKTAEDLARLRAEFGLDVPIPQRYANWLGSALRGDFGTSLVTKRPVMAEIGDRLPNTLQLSLLAFACSLLLAIPIGAISAARQYSRFDAVFTTLAFFGQSIPLFWLGLLLIIFFNVTLKQASGAPLLPGGGMSTIGADFDLGDRLRHLILPTLALTFFNMGTHVRYMRSGMLDVMHQDFVRTARAKGLGEFMALAKHALRNAILPLITIIGLELPGLFNGALITETIFSWPGMGRLFFTSIERSDYGVMMGILMMSATLIIVFGLLTDVMYAVLNPRIRFD
ncbi:MAG: ABC transporter permease [Thermoflexales bacterium]|nr:ABC transporter permease [Thermoflexales bacterium]